MHASSIMKDAGQPQEGYFVVPRYPDDLNQDRKRFPDSVIRVDRNIPQEMMLRNVIVEITRKLFRAMLSCASCCLLDDAVENHDLIHLPGSLSVPRSLEHRPAGFFFVKTLGRGILHDFQEDV